MPYALPVCGYRKSRAKTPMTFFQKKAYEISYALMRLTPTLRNEELARRIEAYAVRLVELSVLIYPAHIDETVALQNRRQFEQTIAVLRMLVLFGEGANELSYQNADVLRNELQRMEDAVGEIEKAREEVSIGHLFSDSPASSAPMNTAQQSESEADAVVDAEDYSHAEIMSGNAAKDLGNQSAKHSSAIHSAIAVRQKRGKLPNELPNESRRVRTDSISDRAKSANSVSAKVRQTAIVGKIAELPNCRIKDLTPIFPNVSERTLRSDVQNLIKRGAIQRGGPNRGPSGYYMVGR